jgi:hypothetical protein
MRKIAFCDYLISSQEEKSPLWPDKIETFCPHKTTFIRNELETKITSGYFDFKKSQKEKIKPYGCNMVRNDLSCLCDFMQKFA